jgi:steroid delta-isomerase-like uncharacterized protein
VSTIEEVPMSLRMLAVVVSLSVVAACTAKEGKVPDTASAASAASPTPSGKAAVEAYVDAWNRRDSTAFDTLFAPGGTHEDIAEGFLGKNPQEVKGFMKVLLTLEPDYKWTLTNVIDHGSSVVAEWTWTATYTGPDPQGRNVKDLKVSGRGVSVVELENGKIKRFTDYYDNASFFPKKKT